jgi:large repetitive protein
MVKLKGSLSGNCRVFRLTAVFVLVILLLCMTLPQTVAAAGTWAASGSLVTGRYGHTATRLLNGKVLVAGGRGALTSAELYDPATGIWSTTGPLAIGRAEHTATLLSDGKVLVAGGDNNGPLTSAEIYDPDPAKGSWTTTNGPLANGRSNHTATLLPTGKVLVAGGYNNGSLPSAEIYDPDAGTWSVTGSLANGRSSHTATLLPTGKVLVAGGYNDGPLASAEIYDPDPAKGTWATTGSLAEGRSEHTATRLRNGMVLVAGGYDAESGIFLSSAEIYDPDPAKGTWTTTGPLFTSRSQHTATLLPTGKVLVAGGLNRLTSPKWLASAELYDPDRATWSATASLNYKRDAHTATLLANGKVLATGGMDNTAPLRSAELYNRPDISAAIYLLLFD